jgi:phytoene desaturase
MKGRETVASTALKDNPTAENHIGGDRPSRGRTALVVGAGLGGLATAARLQHAGWQVTIVERHGVPGGRAGLWSSQGFQFDTGPSLVLMVEYWQQLFRDLGRRLEDYLTLVQLDPNYRIHYPGGDTLEVTSRLNVMMENVERIEPGAGQKLLEFLAHTGKLYRDGVGFIDRNMHRPGSMLNPSAGMTLLGGGALGDLRTMVGRFFRDERLRDAFTFQSLYLGLSPFASLAIYGLLPYTEVAGGLYYPMGGMHALPRAVERAFLELGGQVRYGAEVTRFEQDGKRVGGVILADGTRLAADVVVANSDLPYTYEALAGAKLPGVDRKEFSCSVVLMYLGVNRRYPQLLHHNLIVSDDMRGDCEKIFRRHDMPEGPPFYICAPTRTDPSLAPEGSELLFILALAPSQDPSRPIDWATEGPRFGDKMLDRLERFGLTDLRRHLVTQRLVTPADFTGHYGNLRGEAFGLSHGLTQIGYFRPHNRHRSLENLYFVGQSTHPGCGLPMVLISARLAAERVLEEQGAAR